MCHLDIINYSYVTCVRLVDTTKSNFIKHLFN